jgi:uncharacterized protein YjbI with pentapeptide repeats
MELHHVHESLQLHDSDIAGSDFSNVNAVKTSFDNVNLQMSTFADANLAQTTFDNVNLSNASITDANIAGMRIDGVLVSDLIAAYQRDRH